MMKTTKSPSTPASGSTQLTDAPKSKVSTVNPQVIMQPDKSTKPINPTTPANTDNTVNSNAPANAVNLFDSGQTATTVPASTDVVGQPKQQRIGK